MVHSLPGLKPQSDWQQKHILLRFECASICLCRASFERDTLIVAVHSLSSFAFVQGGGGGWYIDASQDCNAWVLRGEFGER